jgi:hypothetical protein
LIVQNPELAFAGYKLTELYLLKLETRNKLHRLKTLYERFKYFEETRPELKGMIQGKILASFLNVKPQQLSKLYRDLAKEKRL